MDDVLAQFTSITSAEPERAQQYLTLTEGNLEQAIQLYFESDGVDMGGQIGGAPRNSAPEREVVDLDSDAENDDTEGGIPSQRAPQANVEDDEAMARRMQEEMYGGSGIEESADSAAVRAPMARTAETLMGPNADWRDDPGEMNAAVLEQLRARQQRSANRPGIFNQRPPPGSIWEEEPEDPETRRRNLSRATAGASDASSKSSLLAEMYRPPFEIMSNLVTWEGVRAEGKEQEKWIIVNVQDPNIFDCQVLNRDIWKNRQIQETIKENFIFKQYNKDDPQASNYVRFYFQAYESPDAYPHIAIVDPRTGEQVKVWSGTPVPKAMEFLMQLHEFLDRYSLKANTRNPVATRKPEKKREADVERMTEEEMLEMALQNSLAAGPSRPGPRDHDPDVLTRDLPTPVTPNGLATPPHFNGSQPTGYQAPTEPHTPAAAAVVPSPFDEIASSHPHTEPSADPTSTTRIQFRHPGGRVIRRFAVADPVRRLFEWLKAEPLEGRVGVPFELIFMGRNLMDVVELTVEDAGLKNGSVMVEFGEA